MGALIPPSLPPAAISQGYFRTSGGLSNTGSGTAIRYYWAGMRQFMIYGWNSFHWLSPWFNPGASQVNDRILPVLR